MLYNYKDPRQVEQAHNAGEMPDWIYYQQVRIDPATSLEEQRKKIYDRIYAQQAEEKRQADQKRADKETQAKIEKQVCKAVEGAVVDAIKKGLTSKTFDINIKL